MPTRWLALLLLLAVLPTVELTEQGIHVIEHLFEGDPATHSAHHDEEPGDEHGCTGLVHLCSCHHAQVTPAGIAISVSVVEMQHTITIAWPSSLADLNTLEPPHRPPIG